MMDRRNFARLAAAGVFGASLAAAAQPAGKVWRIGFLNGGARPPDGAPPVALRKALQTLGYTEGKDIVYEVRSGEVRNERLQGFATELVALKVDAIVTVGGPSAAAAKHASIFTPVVVVHAGDVVETGLVASLARPGGNVTGVNDPAAVLSSKRLEMLKEMVPAMKQAAVLWNLNDQAMTLRFQAFERAAQLLRVAIVPLGVREPDDFNTALAAMGRAHPDALMMVSDSLTTQNRQRVIDYAAAQRIPAMYEFAGAVRAGGLMSYGSDAAEDFKLAADYVHRILKGARPGELPVEQPNRYFLVINLKTAKALGLVVPQSVLLRADEVIQ